MDTNTMKPSFETFAELLLKGYDSRYSPVSAPGLGSLTGIPPTNDNIIIRRKMGPLKLFPLINSKRMGRPATIL